MQVADRMVVSIHYTLTDAKGEVIDSSEGREPLAYLQGYGNIISGLEKALVGGSVGQKMNVTLSPEEAYGNRDASLLQTLPRSDFEGLDELEQGMRIQTDTPRGPRVVTIMEVDEESVKVDGNHPLAGETLTFDVEIAEIRDATEEELAHGHVHAHGHHH